MTHPVPAYAQPFSRASPAGSPSWRTRRAPNSDIAQAAIFLLVCCLLTLTSAEVGLSNRESNHIFVVNFSPVQMNTVSNSGSKLVQIRFRMLSFTAMFEAAPDANLTGDQLWLGRVVTDPTKHNDTLRLPASEGGGAVGTFDSRGRFEGTIDVKSDTLHVQPAGCYSDKAGPERNNSVGYLSSDLRSCPTNSAVECGLVASAKLRLPRGGWWADTRKSYLAIRKLSSKVRRFFPPLPLCRTTRYQHPHGNSSALSSLSNRSHQGGASSRLSRQFPSHNCAARGPACCAPSCTIYQPKRPLPPPLYFPPAPGTPGCRVLCPICLLSSTETPTVYPVAPHVDPTHPPSTYKPPFPLPTKLGPPLPYPLKPQFAEPMTAGADPTLAMALAEYSSRRPTPPGCQCDILACKQEDTLDRRWPTSEPPVYGPPLHGPSVQCCQVPCCPCHSSNVPPFGDPQVPFPPSHNPPFHAPPFNAPPFHSPPVHAPPFHSPPFHSPPFHSPPVHAPPFHSPPVHASPVHAPPFHAPPFRGPPFQSPPRFHLPPDHPLTSNQHHDLHSWAQPAGFDCARRCYRCSCNCNQNCLGAAAAADCGCPQPICPTCCGSSSSNCANCCRISRPICGTCCCCSPKSICVKPLCPCEPSMIRYPPPKCHIPPTCAEFVTMDYTADSIRSGQLFVRSVTSAPIEALRQGRQNNCQSGCGCQRSIFSFPTRMPCNRIFQRLQFLPFPLYQQHDSPTTHRYVVTSKPTKKSTKKKVKMLSKKKKKVVKKSKVFFKVKPVILVTPAFRNLPTTSPPGSTAKLPPDCIKAHIMLACSNLLLAQSTPLPPCPPTTLNRKVLEDLVGILCARTTHNPALSALLSKIPSFNFPSHTFLPNSIIELANIRKLTLYNSANIANHLAMATNSSAVATNLLLIGSNPPVVAYNHSVAATNPPVAAAQMISTISAEQIFAIISQLVHYIKTTVRP